MTNHDLSTGPITLYISEISTGEPSTQMAGSLHPGGRLTLVAGVPEMLGSDFTSTSVFYSPYVGDTVPIFDGSSWSANGFTTSPLDTNGIGLSCGSKWGVNSKHDIYAYMDGGVVKLGSKVWTAETLAARGLVRRNGLWVNTDATVLDVSSTTTASVPQHQATWLGSINVGSTAGTLKALFTLGQARRCDVWNVYNQREILLGVVQPPVNGTFVSWRPNTQYPVFKPFNENPDNHGIYFTGLPENIDMNWLQRGFVDTTNYPICGFFVGVCKDLITNPVGTLGGFNSDRTGTALGVTAVATFVDRGSIGSHLAIMGTSRVNGNGCTLWGQEPSPINENTQTMWIRYQG